MRNCSVCGKTIGIFLPKIIDRIYQRRYQGMCVDCHAPAREKAMLVYYKMIFGTGGFDQAVAFEKFIRQDRYAVFLKGWLFGAFTTFALTITFMRPFLK